MSAHTGNDFGGTGPLAAIKRWLVGLVAPVFGPETDIVNVAAHFTEYLVFGVLLFLAARQTWPSAKTAQLVLIAIVLASFYAVTDEFHQSFVPGRLCDPADWLTDTLGAGGAVQRKFFLSFARFPRLLDILSPRLPIAAIARLL